MAVAGNNQSFSFEIRDKSDTGTVRRAASELIRDADFNETQIGRIALILTELCNNLVAHTANKGGEILIRRLSFPVPALEIISLDQGPGMASVTQCLRDGYSTAGTAGTGLGAIQRLSDVFDIFSLPDRGAAILCQVTANGAPATSSRFCVGGINIALAGEQRCGDGWDVRLSGERLRLMVADGLGHGPLASDASAEAVRIFRESDGFAVPQLMDRVHGALKKTRGAAVAISEVTLPARELRYSGVGNIAGVFYSGLKRTGMASANGTMGHNVTRISEYKYSFDDKLTLIMHSDGISTRWNFDDLNHQGLFFRHPSLISGVLFRDFRRTKDDSTMIIVRVN